MAANGKSASHSAEMVNVYVPKVPGEDMNLFVSLNGSTYLIPRGKSVEVPKPVAEIIRRSQKAQEKAEEFSEQEREKMKKVVGAD